jgi:hypothetical protein
MAVRARADSRCRPHVDARAHGSRKRVERCEVAGITAAQP